MFVCGARAGIRRRSGGTAQQIGGTAAQRERGPKTGSMHATVWFAEVRNCIQPGAQNLTVHIHLPERGKVVSRDAAGQGTVHAGADEAAPNTRATTNARVPRACATSKQRCGENQSDESVRIPKSPKPKIQAMGAQAVTNILGGRTTGEHVGPVVVFVEAVKEAVQDEDEMILDSLLEMLEEEYKDGAARKKAKTDVGPK